MMKTKEKKEYISPIIEVILVEMECGITANSATIKPNDEKVEIKTEWSKEDNQVIDSMF